MSNVEYLGQTLSTAWVYGYTNFRRAYLTRSRDRECHLCTYTRAVGFVIGRLILRLLDCHIIWTSYKTVYGLQYKSVYTAISSGVTALTLS